MTPTEKWKMIFGSVLLMALVLLAAAIALGKVTEQESFGLVQILTILGILGAKFADWAFGGGKGDKQ